MTMHRAWVRADGSMTVRRNRDKFDANQYGPSGRKRRAGTQRGPLVIVACRCGADTVARSVDADTLAGWRVEWPAQVQEFMRVSGKCPNCAKE